MIKSWELDKKEAEVSEEDKQFEASRGRDWKTVFMLMGFEFSALVVLCSNRVKSFGNH